MIQASLLTTADVPDNAESLQKWAERIRSRILTLNRQIASLEEEKRTLLIKLQEASLSTMLIGPDSPAHSNISGNPKPESLESNVCDSAPVSIVNLVESSQSDIDTGNHDLMIDDNLQSNEPISPEAEAEHVYTGEVDSVLENLDPRELSFDPDQDMCQTENSPPPNVPSEKSRVYKVCEFSEIDWDEVSSIELKQWLQFLGLKPALGGRKVMVEKLGEIFKYISGTGDYLKHPSDDQFSFKYQLFAQFKSAIVSNHEMYEKIVCFESIDIGEVFDYLAQSIKDKPFSVKHVKEYLDQIHVQYSTTSAKFSNKKVVSRKPRKIRKSISCPM